MTMAKSTLLAALAAVAATGASAQTNYMASSPNVTSINANPNATAIVPVAGWNLQKTFPGRWDGDADPVKGGWTMHLNITANVTAERDFANSNETRATRISFQLKPPAGLIDPQSGNWTVDRQVLDSWRMWFVQFGRHSIVPGGRNNDDGSCTNILRDDCIASLKAELAATRAVVQGNDSQPLYGGLASKCPFEGSSNHNIPLDSDFTLNATLYSDDPIRDDKHYENAYDFYGSRSFAFAIIFGHSNSTELITGQPLEHDHVAVGCIKADTKMGESRLPSGGVGSVERRLSTVSLLSVVAVAGLMMLL